jgi:hypothetical protein
MTAPDSGASPAAAPSALDLEEAVALALGPE